MEKLTTHQINNETLSKILGGTHGNDEGTPPDNFFRG